MADKIDELLQTIYDAGEGPEIAAFFDFDNTLIAGYSVQAVFEEQLRAGEMSLKEFRSHAAAAAKYSLGRINFSGLVSETASAMRGQAEYVMEEFGERVFKKRIAGQIYPEARSILEAHREMGHTIAIVSSATKYQIEPAARELDIDYILCTDLEIEDGIFTGDVIHPTCFGDGKRTAAEDFCEDFKCRLDRSFFYTDSDDDLPLLDVVAHPRVVNPNTNLSRIARRRSWPVYKFESRGRPKIQQIARTGAAYALLPTALAATVPIWALTGKKRDALNTALSLWTDYASALAGLSFDIEGEEHLWSHRPAVFIFNHQSSIDPIIIGKLLKRDVTGIGKKEIANFPIVGAAFRYADIVFIDRTNTEKAIDAMKPVIEAIKKDCLSVTLAPEGTRSPATKLGRFKKGAFHIAMQAGVPIVPIVIHNATDSLPKGRNIPRKAKIYVTVLPPVDTSKWKTSKLEDHIEDVRHQYLEALGQDDEAEAS